ncbi:MAG: hypothetical protein V3575_06825 [Candidatus Absconditabacteria bacterium]
MKSKMGFVRIAKIILLVIAVFNITSFSSVFAAEASNSMVDSFLSMFDLLGKVLLSIWFIPAILAGKLLTNDLVMGEMFGMSFMLWKLWNIMKIFALYTLGFYTVYLILKGFFKGESISVVKSGIGKIMLAGVLINFSWFLMLVLIDISTIMVAGVGSFPTEFFGQAEYRKTLLAGTTNIPETLVMHSSSTDSRLPTFEKRDGALQLDNNELVANILARENDMSGPLLYLGFAIMRFQDYPVYTDQILSSKNIAFATVIKIVLIMMFVIPLLVLAVVNMIRIVYIWIWLVFSPFIVLDSALGGFISKTTKSEKIFKLGNIVGLVFQPVAVIGCLSLGLILASFVNSIFQGNDNNSKEGMERMGITCDHSGSKCTMESIGGEVTLEGNIITESKDALQGGLGYLIVALLTVFMLWALIKVGFKSSEITKGFTDKTFGFIEGMGKALPILPGGVSVGAAKTGVSNLERSIIAPLQARDTTRVQNYLNSIAGLSNSDLSGEEVAGIKQKLGSAGSELNSARILFTYLRENAIGKDVNFTSSRYFRQIVLDWISSDYGKQYLKLRCHVTDDELKNPESVLNNKYFRNFFIQAMNENANMDVGNPKQVADSIHQQYDGDFMRHNF